MNSLHNYATTILTNNQFYTPHSMMHKGWTQSKMQQ